MEKAKKNGKPGKISASVVVRSATGKSVTEGRHDISPLTVKQYLPSNEGLKAAAGALKELGFDIQLVAPSHIAIGGEKELFEKIFGVRLTRKTAPYFTLPDPKHQATQSYFESSKPPKIPPSLRELVETVEFPGAVTYYITATPPALAYDHLEVPDDVARDMDAVKAHQRSITGAGIDLAMVDSGFMTPWHPYYVGKGYNIQPLVPETGDPNPNVDSVGHGTGISACALAVAPGVRYTVYKIYSNPATAFGLAVAANPQAITCSWGTSFSSALQLSINNAVASGITVCFACGNGGPVGWPGSEPAVISVGGAFIGDDDSIQAASYASSGTNATNPGRQAPDLCGVVGMAPAGVFIALPTQPSSQFDVALSGGTYPSNDTTASNDGWLVASGTSSATPMVAATAALIMQANPVAVGSPALVRATLIDSCIDVTTGNSASGQAAGAGADLATGAGLVQAYRAVHGTDLWMRDNPDTDIGLVRSITRRPAYPPHAFWVSPDIRVFDAALANPAADFAATPEKNPVFNQDSFVYLQVRNRGIQATGAVSARLYYADPATSLLYPTDWKDGQSGVPAQGSIYVNGVATNLQTIPSVAPGATVILPYAYVWRPPDPTTATQTQTLTDGRIVGHFCLLARLESPDDSILVSSGWGSITGDNNVGLKNQQVYSAPPGHDFFFTFYVRGATKREGATRNEVLFDLSRIPRSASVMVQLSPKDAESARPINAKRAEGGILLSTGKQSTGWGLTLNPETKLLAKVVLRTSKRTPPGDYAIDVTQSSGEKALGGVRLVARVND
jgi:hypothetical protein